jgi:hypothetical protein
MMDAYCRNWKNLIATCLMYFEAKVMSFMARFLCLVCVNVSPIIDLSVGRCIMPERQ